MKSSLLKIVPKFICLCAVFGLSCSVWANPDIELMGRYTTDKDITCTTDTRVKLKGVTFTDCSLKLRGDVNFTIEIVDGTQNVFHNVKVDQECIKATKSSNIIFTGKGILDLMSGKRITDQKQRSGILVCNNLKVEDGDISITFDNDRNDTSCVFLKGNYLQTGGKVKLDLKKKNCTNELHGVTFDTAGSTFTLAGGKFNAEIAGTKSRAIDLKKSGKAFFRGGSVKAEFEGPKGRFVNGGTIEFSGGKYLFTTNITAKMAVGYYPTDIAAVRADYSVLISGGDFEADLPLKGSEVFTNDQIDGTDVTISGGKFDLVSENDCIHATKNISIAGGRIKAVSMGDDAIDANGGMEISGGEIRAYAVSENTHGLDVNKGDKLKISGGIVIATDGPNTHRIGSGESDVGKVDFEQPTYYGTLSPASDYSRMYLCLEGQTNGVSFVFTKRLPALQEGDFNLLVSVPGRAASKPVPMTEEDVASSYFILTDANGGEGVMEMQIVKVGNVYGLQASTLMPPADKTRFVGWEGSNERMYDDGMVVFDLAEPGEIVKMKAIWE